MNEKDKDDFSIPPGFHYAWIQRTGLFSFHRKILRNQKKSREIFGGIFQVKNSPVFHIVSRRIKSKSTKDLSTAYVAHSIILFF